MPRRERPLDPDGDALTRFAVDLRRLRQAAGTPTYRDLARRAHYAAGTLSDAAGGRKLPTLAVTLAYVKACGGDAEEWERRWHAVAAEADPPAPAEADGTECPYVGLAAFQPEDADRFFGRDGAIEALARQVAARRLVAVFGASGAGKSSLLRAGLLPAARTGALGDGNPWPAVLLTPGAHPLEECAIRFARLTGSTPGRLKAEFAAEPRNLHLIVRQVVDAHPAGVDLLLVVDQFEEVFTQCTDDGERAAFLRAVLAATQEDGSRCRVVLGIRTDFYTHCAQQRDLADAIEGAQQLLGPMRPDELRAAVTGPAARAGLIVENALMDRIVADTTGRPGSLPLLSHALLETWRRRHGHALTLSGYEKAGGIHGAIARTAEHTYTTLSGDQRQRARQILLRSVALGEGTEDTRRRIAGRELDLTPDTVVVLDALARARLLTLDHDAVEIAHEALIRAWPRLRGWLDEDRDGLRLQRRLTDDAAVWRDLDHDPGVLYRGTRLTVVREWARDSRTLLTTDEQEFLDAGLAADTAEQSVWRRRTRQLRWLAATLAVLLVAAAAVAAVAVRQRERASALERIATSRQLAADARGFYANNDTTHAAQLGLAAYRLAPTDEARDILVSAAARRVRLPPDVETVRSELSPDGRLLATTGFAGGVQLWGLPSAAKLASIATDPSRTPSLAFSPDGRLLVVGDGSGTTRLIDVSDPRRPLVLAGIPLSGPAAVSPDGDLLSIAGTESTEPRLWSIKSPREPRGISGFPQYSDEMTLGVDGIILIRQREYEYYQVWKVDQGSSSLTEISRLPPEIGQISTSSRDGRTLVTRDLADTTATTLRLWDVPDFTVPHPRQLASIAVAPGSGNAQFSADGNALAIPGPAPGIQLLDVSDPGHPRKHLDFADPGLFASMAFNPGGRQLVSTDLNRFVYFWDTDVDRAIGRVERRGP
ncbi:nSTAND1 domain-containing NTPase [Amycolatopsis sp. NPDC004747]